MRALLILLALGCVAAAPSRTQTYTAGQVIDPADVTENEDNIYSYLQSGVDTYRDGTILTDDISNGTITASDLATGAATSAVILDATIVTGDISTGGVATGNILDDTVSATDLSATLTFSDGDFLNLSSINTSGTSEGLRLPQATSCASGTAEGQLCWDTDGDTLIVGDSSTVQTFTPKTVADVVTRTAGDVATTSTSLVDFTGASITLTTGANPVLVGFAGNCRNSVQNANMSFQVDVDGTDQFGTGGFLTNADAADEEQNCSFAALTADVTAASHTFKLQWMVSSGTGTVDCDSAIPCTFWVTEVVD